MSVITRSKLSCEISSSASLAEADSQWFKRLAFPVVAGGATVRAGVRYYFF